MTSYSDLVVARGITATTPRAEVEMRIQQVMSDPALTLPAKGLFVLLAEQGGTPVDPFDDAYEKAEVIYAAIAVLIQAGLALRV